MLFARSMKRTSSMIAATFLLGLPAVHAEDSYGSGFYASAFVGANFASDAEFSGNIGGNPQTVENDYDTGFVVGGALGRSWGKLGGIALRTEIEISHRDNDVDEINFSGNGPAPEINVDGDSSSTSILANALVDFPIANIPLTPYAGVGLGVAFTEQDFVYGPGVVVGDSDIVFAGQFIAGVSYDVSDRFALTLDGRYHRAFGVESNRLAPNGTNTGVIEEDLDSFSASVGLRVKF